MRIRGGLTRAWSRRAGARGSCPAFGEEQSMPYIMTGYGDVAYLHKVTEFITACRQEDPLAGMWDVGDLQWWWRDDEYTDPTMQMFWEDHQGTIGGVVLL